MKSVPKKNKKVSLVTDQLGRQIFVFGLVLSVAIGFTLRGLTSPRQLHQKLMEATQSIGSETSVSWSQVNLSLKNGPLLPRFAVVIQNVKVVSQNKCWGEPILFSKEVEVPLSIAKWIYAGQPLDQIVLNESFLELRSAIECEKAPDVKKDQKEDSQKLVRMKSKQENIDRPPLVLTEFVFNQLKIRHEKWIYKDWALKTLNLKIHENQPWYATLKADFPIPDTESVDSNVRINLSYKEFPTPIFDLSINGHWREGNFKMSGLWDQTSQGWSFKTQFDHFSFQFLKTLALKTKTPWNWPDRPMWFSFTSESSNQFSDWRKSQHLLRGIKVEGDLGQIQIPDLRISSLQPFQVAPFVFQIEKADLTTAFLNNFNNLNSVKSLGFLTGEGEWLAQDEFRFRGNWLSSIWNPSDSFQYFNDFQISNATVQASLKKSRWKIITTDPLIEKVQFQGEMTLEGDQRLASGSLKTFLTSQELPSQLVKNAGLIKSKSISLSSTHKWTKNSQQALYQLNLDLYETDQLRIDKLKLNLKRQDPAWELKLQTGSFLLKEKLRLTPEHPSFQYPLYLGSASLEFARLNADLIRWSIQSNPLQSSGSRLQDERLSGNIKLNGQSLVITGTEKQPEIFSK